MDPVSLGLGLAVGLALGGLAAYLMASRRHGAAQAETIRLQAEADALRQQAGARESELSALRQRLADSEEQRGALREEQARLQTALEGERKSAAERQAAAESAEKRLREAFDSLSGEALRKNNQSFLELAKTHLGEYQKLARQDLESRQKSIGELVKPIRESLGKVDSRLEAVESARRQAYGALSEQVKTMAVQQEGLKKETANLVQALRRPEVRGNWGEMQLRRVVEMAGMQAHCDFTEQVGVLTGEGRALRPDMVVNLPGGKQVVVDAKAPLDAYLRATESEDDANRTALHRDHAMQVRDHIRKLSAKSYWTQFEQTPEFVVMFLPGETFFSAALQADPALLEFGVENRVVLASPTTLIALLQAVAFGWKQEALAENARAISDLGRELYDRVRVMADHFGKVGKHLNQSVEAYNSATRSLESRVLVQARRFRELQSASEKPLPELDTLDATARAIESPELLDDENAGGRRNSANDNDTAAEA